MKQTSTFLKVLLAIFFFQYLSAQVPIDFEFLDHRSNTINHMESKILNDKLVSVHNMSSWPMTTVNLVDLESNAIDTIMSTYFSQSDLFEFSDGSFDIYLHSMFDYDVFVSGFFHISFDGNSFDIDTLHSYILNDPSIDTDIYPSSIIENKNGGYYILDYDSLYTSDKVSLTGLKQAGSDHKLFQNDAGDGFLYRGQHIVKILDNGFDTIQTIVDLALEINNNGQFNDVLTRLEVQRWNDDFSQLVTSWPLPEEVDYPNQTQLQSFYKIHVADSLLTLLYNRADRYEYITVTQDGDQNVASFNYENDEAIGFHLFSESTRLSVHNYIEPEIQASQLLYRHASDIDDIEYDRRQVSLESLSVEYLSSDTLSVFVNSAGDTLYFVDETVELDLRYTNNSDTSIRHANVLSSDVFSPYFFMERGLNYTFNELLQPTQTKDVDTLFNSAYGIPSVVTMAIPGADYRINDDPNRIITVDVVLDVDKVIYDETIKLFPNPTDDLLNIESENRILELAIYNAQGQLVMLKAGQSDLNKINVQELNPDAYFIKLRMDKQNTYGIQQFIKL